MFLCLPKFFPPKFCELNGCLEDEANIVITASFRCHKSKKTQRNLIACLEIRENAHLKKINKVYLYKSLSLQNNTRAKKREGLVSSLTAFLGFPID